VRTILYCVFKILFRLRVEGLENIPAEGQVIFASNHLSNFDPPLVGAAATRPISFMAKEELFKNPLFGSIIRALRAFPVKRGTGD
jgi:1-acyl-sn-glycerol-3-phosphate acyltransferase